ncbi:MAG TPA: diadenylate cyclase CdaA [Chloroflexota bacterium]|nr:diadenylate cyclase CdaA [Chloroflexota bacterium]
MATFLETVFSTLSRLDASSVLDILIVAAIVYGILTLIEGTTAVALVRGMITVFLLAAVLGSVFDLVVLNWLLRNSIPALLVSIPILFQPELRRAFERMGRTSHLFSRTGPNNEIVRAMEQIAVACRRLSDRKWGALMVLERETALGEYVDTGIEIDGLVSVDFLMSIFYPNSPLHDGAVVIRGDRVVAAACLLPLTENILSDQHLGTRHRAGVGITERTDSVAIIVSEETGVISLANNGRIVRNLDESKLRKVLPALFRSRAGSTWMPAWLSDRVGSTVDRRQGATKSAK